MSDKDMLQNKLTLTLLAFSLETSIPNDTDSNVKSATCNSFSPSV